MTPRFPHSPAARVLRVLACMGPLTSRRLSLALGIGPALMSQTLSKLTREGQIQRVRALPQHVQRCTVPAYRLPTQRPPRPVQVPPHLVLPPDQAEELAELRARFGGVV